LSADRQRIDKWLWHARLVRTRSAAAILAASGHVRVNGLRVAVPARVVRPGDVVTVALDRAVRVLKVTALAERRGPAETARRLYEDLSPLPAAPRPSAAARLAGSGRPTKRDRRMIGHFTGEGDQ
jgi:ribosome-associated heat shock protein Hsp15